MKKISTAAGGNNITIGINKYYNVNNTYKIKPKHDIQNIGTNQLNNNNKKKFMANSGNKMNVINKKIWIQIIKIKKQ